MSINLEIQGGSPPQVVKVDGVCYQFLSSDAGTPTAPNPSETFDTCSDCEASSTPATSSESLSSTASESLITSSSLVESSSIPSVLSSSSGSSGNCECVDVSKAAAMWLCAENLALADLDDFSVWPDVGGLGNDATTVNSPQNDMEYHTEEVNGLPAVEFDRAGNNANGQAPHNAGLAISNEATFICVYKPNGGSPGYLFSKGGQAGLTKSLTIYHNFGNRVQVDCTETNPLFTTTRTDAGVGSVDYIVLSVKVTNAKDAVIKFNGVVQPVTVNNGTGGDCTDFSNALPVSVGCSQDSIGAPNGAELDGKVAEWLFFNTAKSDQDIIDIETCLIARYALPEPPAASSTPAVESSSILGSSLQQDSSSQGLSSIPSVLSSASAASSPQSSDVGSSSLSVVSSTPSTFSSTASSTSGSLGDNLLLGDGDELLLGDGEELLLGD